MNNKIRFAFLHVLMFLAISMQAARVDTLKVESPRMQRSLEVVVIVPDQALQGKKVPTLYLLHGHSGNAHSWLHIQPALPALADRDGILVVCPDGRNSWYWDSPVNEKSQFETFVSKELIKYIDSHYPTLKHREARAVTGLSMGGQGSFWLAFHHKDVFGAAGSTSGGLDIRPFPKNWNMSDVLGKKSENPQRWDAFTIINQLDLIDNGDLALIFDCGVNDFFYKVNCNFHEALLKRGIEHDFISRPGAHTQTYWKNSIEYQWLFFNKFFKGYRFKK